MPLNMKDLLKTYAEQIHGLYGESLKAVILYGSYARGDFTSESDVDIMILVDLPDQELCDSRKKVSNLTYDFNMDHDLEIMPVIVKLETYRYWLPVYPFYQNIDKEGVSLYAA